MSLPGAGPEPGHEPALELALHGPTRGLLRGISATRPRSRALHLSWFDPGSALRAEGLLVERERLGRRERWRLLRLVPRADEAWLPGQPAPVLHEALSLAGLTAVAGLGASGMSQDAPVAEGAALGGFEGREQMLPAEGVRLLTGMLWGPALRPRRRAVARLLLQGRAALDRAAGLAAPQAGPGRHAMALARQGLAAEAIGGAPRRRGPPVLPRQGHGVQTRLGDGFVQAAGHLLDLLLDQLDRIVPPPRGRDAEHDPEPVHQARVALRRLRSLIVLCREALGCPALAAVAESLKALAALLGPARDWDVFLSGTLDGLAAALDEAGEAEDGMGLARVVAAARRERAAAYAALAGWRRAGGADRLALDVALLLATRPWEAQPWEAQPREAQPREAQPREARPREAADAVAPWQVPLRDFAARALRRRARRLRRVGGHLEGVPLEALHRLRLDSKRLRYAAELFAPLFPGRHARRLLRRLAVLQETLGHLNDGAVAALLMGRLGAAGRGHGAGLVRGYVAGRQAAALAPAERAWRRLRAAEPFWK